MDIISKFKALAKSNKKRIVLPEGCEPRTVEAASIITKEGLAEVVLLGKREYVEKTAADHNINISDITVIDPETSEKLNEYANTFYELRKHKGVSENDAIKTCKDEIYFATMMVHAGDADGFVSGAEHSTGDTIRPPLQIIKTKPGINSISSSFVMIVPDCDLGDDGMFIFADCAVNPNPTAEQLGEIAVASAETARVLCQMDPRVAMLSFSTKGSAKHELADKVIKATEVALSINPELKIDGEFQADAAIIHSIGVKKAPGSKIAGQANVLVFPDLQSGNIAYKLVQRLAKAEAVGPILQGLNKPVNDLSRGCSVEDIVNVTAITAVQAQG
ncbi:MAG: phosphate acetyltransferase [Pseudomonadota bacterium]